MNDKDSAYIVQILSDDEEGLQVFCVNKFEMMSVLKKALQRNELITHVEALDYVLTGKDYLDEIDQDLNFGIQQ